MEFRKMEGKKKKNNEATQNSLRMQRQQIAKMKLENDRLKDDLAIETRQAGRSSKMSSTGRVDRLKDEADEMARKIVAERKTKMELESKIKEIDHKANAQRDAMRSHMQGFSSSRDYNLRVQREIRRYESRLDKARIKFNEAQAHNNRLRENIDNLRKDRDSYDSIFKKLTKELSDKKNDVQKLIKSSNEAYKSRGDAQSEMMELKARADKEQHHFQKKLRHMGATMSKEQAAEDQSMDATVGRRRSNQYDALAEGNNSEQKLRDSVAASGERIANNIKEIHLSKEKVRKFEEAFEMIQKATKISDINELVDAFITAEDRNFNLFNQVNDLTATMETQEKEIAEIKAQAEKFKTVGAGIEADKIRKEILSNMQKKQKATAGKASLFEKKYEDTLKLIAFMKENIQAIFEMVDCDKMPSAHKLLTEGVTETNMVEYLGLIEEQTNDMLDVYAQIQDEEDEKHEEEAEAAEEAAEKKAVEQKEAGAQEEEEEKFEVQQEGNANDEAA